VGDRKDISGPVQNNLFLKNLFPGCLEPCSRIETLCCIEAMVPNLFNGRRHAIIIPGNRCSPCNVHQISNISVCVTPVLCSAQKSDRFMKTSAAGSSMTSCVIMSDFYIYTFFRGGPTATIKLQFWRHHHHPVPQWPQNRTQHS
jgi:hypothetical protein